MKVGCVKEIKKHEYRVGLTPSDVKSYITRGHHVLIETNAGLAAGFEDMRYKNAGATVTGDREEIFSKSDMIIKVKEPLPEEYNLFKKDQIL